NVVNAMPVKCASATSDAMTDVRCRQVSKMMLNPELAMKKKKELKPLTEDEKRRLKRECQKIEARYQADKAAGHYDAIDRQIQAPERSFAATIGQTGNGKHHHSQGNGRHRPSTAGSNGDFVE